MPRQYEKWSVLVTEQRRGRRRVVVAVLTFRRRAELAALLPELLRQTDTVPECTVLVVDNDSEASAQDVVLSEARRRSEPGRSELVYVHEPRPGIAAARNRALDEAHGASLLVFLDDDERPVPGWLQALLAVHDQTGAGVVGPVVSEFAVQPDTWVTAGDFFNRRQLPTGTPVDVAATNNLLLDLEVVQERGLRFDERFGLSGGSDTLFTRQLVQRGGRLVWCSEALVVDVVPAGRVTRRWVLHRAFRSGNGWTRTSLALASSARGRAMTRVRLAGQGVVRLLGGGAQAATGLLSGSLRQQARGCRTLARGAGMLSALAGHVFVEYARPAHGAPTRDLARPAGRAPAGE